MKKYHAVFIIFVQHIYIGLQNVNKGTQHTAIRGTLRGRVKLRHIMFMSGHRKGDLSVVMPENAQVIKNGIQKNIFHFGVSEQWRCMQEHVQRTKLSFKSFIHNSVLHNSSINVNVHRSGARVINVLKSTSPK